MKDKKGAATSSATWIIGAVIGAVVLFYLAANLWPTLADSLGDLANTSSMPLASIFAASGIVGILFAVALLYAGYKMFWKK